MADDNKPKPSILDRLYEQKRASDPDLPPADPAIEAAISEPTPPSDEKQLNVKVPEYVYRQIKQLAGAECCTNRYLVLEALQKIGIVVSEADRQKDRR